MAKGYSCGGKLHLVRPPPPRPPPPKSGRQSHKISTCPENIINRNDTVHGEMCCNSGPPSRPHLCQTNGKFRNKSTAAAGQQNGDCPVRQQGWPDAEDNGSIVLHFSGCGQAELAGIIWILYGTIPSYSVHSIALQTRGGGRGGSSNKHVHSVRGGKLL